MQVRTQVPIYNMKVFHSILPIILQRIIKEISIVRMEFRFEFLSRTSISFFFYYFCKAHLWIFFNQKRRDPENTPFKQHLETLTKHAMLRNSTPKILLQKLIFYLRFTFFWLSKKKILHNQVCEKYPILLSQLSCLSFFRIENQAVRVDPSVDRQQRRWERRRRAAVLKLD